MHTCGICSLHGYYSSGVSQNTESASPTVHMTLAFARFMAYNAGHWKSMSVEQLPTDSYTGIVELL